jgi:hypothetical protein
MLKRFHEIFGTIPRLCLYALLIFTPLAMGSAPTWAMMVIHIITLIALTSYLIEKIVTWEWQWTRTPIDLPLAVLLNVVLLSTIFSTDRYTSIWSLNLLGINPQSAAANFANNRFYGVFLVALRLNQKSRRQSLSVVGL